MTRRTWTAEDDAFLLANGMVRAAAKFGVSFQAARRRHQRLAKSQTQPTDEAVTAAYELATDDVAGPSAHEPDAAPELVHNIVKLTKKRAVPLFDLCEKLDVSPGDLRQGIDTAKSLGFAVQLVAGHVSTRIEPGAHVHATWGESVPGRRYRVAHVTDVHWGSKFCDEPALLEFLKKAWDLGCRSVVFTGDGLDGHKEVLLHEQTAIGFDAQCDAMVKCLAKAPPFAWFGIGGNHDGYHSEAIGMSVGPVVEARLREAGVNWTNVGDCYGHATVHGAKWQLWHPHGGASTRNAIRRILNARVEHIARDDRPDVLAMGHFHKHATVLTYPEKVFCIAGGTFQQMGSRFAVRMSNFWDIGASIVSYTIGSDGKPHEFSSEFFEAPRWPVLNA